MMRDDVLVGGAIWAQCALELRLYTTLEAQMACQRLLVLILAVAFVTAKLIGCIASFWVPFVCAFVTGVDASMFGCGCGCFVINANQIREAQLVVVVY